MDISRADFFDGVPSSKDNESATITTTLTASSLSIPHAQTQLNNDSITNTTATRSPHLPSPSPELVQAQAWTQGRAIEQQLISNNGSKKAIKERPPYFPSPSSEYAHGQARTAGHLYRQQEPANSLNNNSNNTAAGHSTAHAFLNYNTPLLYTRNGVGAAQPPLGLELGTSQPSSNLGDDPGAFQPVYGYDGGVMASSARFEYGETISPSDHRTVQSTKQSNADQVATCLTNEEFVRILLTPDPELTKAVQSIGKTDVAPRNFTTTAKGTTSVQGKTIEQRNSMSPAFILTHPPQGSVTSAPAPATVSRRRIQFDSNPPRIISLDQDRVKGPPKLPEEVPERFGTALRRATQEYLDDSELWRELEKGKRVSLNAQLHAVFPIVTHDEKMSNSRPVDQQTTEERVNKKYAIDNVETEECSTDEPATKKTRVTEGTTAGSSSSISTGEHLVMQDGAIEYSTMGNATLDDSIIYYTTIEHSTNIKRHAVDETTDDHNTFDHQVKTRRTEDHLTTQSSPNNNATTDRQAQENSVSSNNSTAITTTSGFATNNLPIIETVTSEDLATYSHRHPEFDDMIMDNEFGKAMRKARWELCYPMVDAQMWQEDEMAQEDPIHSNL
ncbi:hypothetical protein KI688_000945 [Linnemannia hyalina]|uniref:Uncharacterized protein n=1 Tax=Linnemannia hyalina TaxID=64524 RepID=A0A9P7Y686_9FUNG|nr:hypothetical protein KI688_000945 [Linnemannia hyalina]